jgi:aryl-alcohol dehydrogenase-like predicted oxidoreductase
MDSAVQEVKDHSLAMFRRQYDETAALLGTHLGLYQVHSATLESGVLDDAAVLGALVGLGRTGVAVGLTVSGPHQADVVRRALEVDVDGVNPFSTVQATWNLLEPSAGAALAAAHHHGWGVIVKEVLANGRLTDAARDPGAGPGAATAERHGTSLEQVAFAAALAQPWADVVLSGAVDPGQLDIDLRAGAEASPHSPAPGSAPARDSPAPHEAAALAAMAEPPDVYWRRRSGLPWH